jgi:hypothetical protein
VTKPEVQADIRRPPQEKEVIPLKNKHKSGDRP